MYIVNKTRKEWNKNEENIFNIKSSIFNINYFISNPSIIHIINSGFILGNNEYFHIFINNTNLANNVF